MSQLAKKLIAENRRSRATFLDLGNCGLTKVPAEVGELVWLESLSLASQWWEWDGQDWQPRESANKGSENERLVDIGPLGRLTALRSVAFGRVADLVPLTRLTKLEKLILLDPGWCSLMPLVHFTALQELVLLRAGRLPPLTDLRSLRKLCCESNDLSELKHFSCYRIA